MIEIITEKEKWDALLSEFDSYDTYHTFDYHMISRLQEESPILIKYTEKELVIGVPLLLRNINDTHYNDATSVYGYCGPLSKGVTDNFDNSSFIEALKDYFIENNIISVFSRLNPYIANQNKVLNNLGEIFPLGKVVNINLKLDKTIQRQNYHRRLKNHINKSRRNCKVVKAKSIEEIENFIEIYKENMIRVNAKKSYYFSKEYFLKLFESKNFKTEILLAIDKESKKIISGAMFFKTNSIVQYHLSGTKNDFLHLMPTKLLIDEMRITATDSGFKTFNLGGGLAASGDDSLFRFKSSFSDNFHPFSLWKLIINQKAYDEVCDKNEIINRDSKFFPLYRLKEHL